MENNFWKMGLYKEILVSGSSKVIGASLQEEFNSNTPD